MMLSKNALKAHHLLNHRLNAFTYFKHTNLPNLIIQSTSKEELTKKLSSMSETISMPPMSNMLADENSCLK